MASAKNKVIAGDYYNYKASANIGTVTISMILVGTVNIDSTTVKRYEVITDEQRKSAMSGAARGLAGKMLLGDVGAMAGVYSAKGKGVYQIAIEFKDGKRSLLEVDDKIYKLIIKNCFACVFDDDEQIKSESSKIEDTKEPELNIVDEVSEQPKTFGVEPTKNPKKHKGRTGCLIAVLIFLFAILILLIVSSTSKVNDVNKVNVSPTTSDLAVIAGIVPESSDENVEEQKTITIVAGEKNEYAELFTLNAGTEFEETQYVYYIPVGTYTAKSLSDYSAQISVYSRGIHVTEEGWEEPKEFIFAKVLSAGESTEITIGEDQYIEIHEPDIIELLKVE